jgi:hypothetical protein
MEYIAALETGTGMQGPEHRHRKPPPASALEPWVRRNWRVEVKTKSGETTRRRAFKGKMTDRKAKALKSAVFLLQRKIAIYGTPPHWMFRDGLKASVPFIESAFEKAVKGWA